MDGVFLHFVNLSITAGYIVIAVILLRLLLKKAPRWVSCLLWGIVGLRLVFPVSLESVFSLIPSTKTISADEGALAPFVQSGFNAVDGGVNGYLGDRYAEGITVPANLFENTLNVLAVIWVIGILAMLIYTVVTYLRIRSQVKTATVCEKNVFKSEFVKSPFILGVIKPKIYLPYGIDEKSAEYVLAHEKAHLKRLDHLIKPFAFLVLAVYWFNPLIWLAYILLCRDIELACDEKVIKDMEKESRQDYSRALLTNSVNRRSVAACPLAFGEVGVKERVKSVMSYKKPAFWIIIAAAVICIVSAVCFLTNPKTADIKGKYLETTGVVYQNGSYSLSVTPENAPKFKVTEDMNLLVSESEGKYWDSYGSLFKRSLSRDNFDKFFTNKDIWEPGFSAASLRMENRNAYQAGVLTSEGKETIYYLLEQKNGDIYLVKLYEDPDIDRHIFAVYAANTTDTAPKEKDSDPSGDDINFSPYFNATVIEVGSGAVLVTPFEGSGELKTSDKIWVSTNVISANQVPEMKAGDRIRIVYNGEIAETYPAQINKVFAIYPLGDEGEVLFTPIIDKSRVYKYEGNKNEPANPFIRLNDEDKTYEFFISSLSSFVSNGTFEEKGERLTLKDDEGRIYTFNFNGSSYIFDAANSSEIPSFSYFAGSEKVPAIPDKAEFKAYVSQ